jgi:ABC-type multidrug transport system fused ATPase/permease subunit
MNLVVELWGILTRAQRRDVLAMQAVSVIMAFSTIVGIAAIAPFFAVLGAPQLIDQNRLLRWLYVSGGFADRHGFVVALGVLFIAVVLLANLVNALGSLAMNRLALRIGTELQSTLYAEYLQRPYSFHAATNSTLLFSNVVYETARVTNGVVQNLLLLITNLITAAFIIVSILLVNPLISITMLLMLAGGYVLIYLGVRRRLLQLGRSCSSNWAELARVVNESLAAIREVLLLRGQRFFGDIVRDTGRDLSRTNAHIFFVGQAPKHIMECVAVSGLVGSALLVSARSGSMGAWLGELTFVAFGAYRLLPILQQVFAAAVRIRADRPALSLIAPDLRQAQLENETRRPRAPVPGDRRWQQRPRVHISLEQASFQYPGSAGRVLEGLNVSIPAGATVALVGANGSGKTTLMDLIAGLLVPTTGVLRVDGVAVHDGNRAAWQAQIAYVPQNVFLLDSSIAQNIAFGLPEHRIDQSRMVEAARAAQLEPFVQALPEQYRHRIGERGVRLSGGQRQRIGIARALYRRAPLLLLDEAMSAQDRMTEAELMSALESLRGSCTIVLIAHRLNMVRWCDLVFQLEDGRVSDSGSCEELSRKSEPFRRIMGAL